MITGPPDSWIESNSHWSGRDPSDAGYCDECGEHIDSGRCQCSREDDSETQASDLPVPVLAEAAADNQRSRCQETPAHSGEARESTNRVDTVAEVITCDNSRGGQTIFSEPIHDQTAGNATPPGSESLSTLYPEPFGINEVLAHFKRKYAPVLVEPLPPPTEEAK